MGFNELLESIFFILLVVEMFSLQKINKILEEVVVSWQEIRSLWQMIMAKLCSRIHSRFEAPVV